MTDTDAETIAENKTKTIKVRLTEADHLRLTNLAHEHRVSAAELVRQSIGKCREWSPVPSTLTDAELQLMRSANNLTVAIDRIGNNVNQLAKLANEARLKKQFDNDVGKQLLMCFRGFKKELEELHDVR